MAGFPLMDDEMRKELAKRRDEELEVVAKTSYDEDGVDEPGEGSDVDQMSDDEKRARGAAAAKTGQESKSLFKSIVFGESRVYPLEDQPSRQPRVVDEGEDALGRDYSDAVMDRIAGAFSAKQGGDPDAVPSAGAGPTFEGDTRDITYRPAAFTQGDDQVGQEPRRGPFAPNMGKGPGSYDLEEAATAPVRVGENWVMSPRNSGIAPAAGFEAPGPVRKSRKTGIFKSAIFGAKGDQADSFLSE